MRLVKIKDIGTVVSGSTPSTSVKEYWGGDIAWVTPKEINSLNSPYLESTERTITSAGFEASSTQLLPKGSILFTSRAPIGLVAIANIDVCTNQGFKSIIPFDGYYPLYIYYILKFRAKRLDSLGTGTTFRELSKSTFEKFEVPVPDSLEEQIAIAENLFKAETLIKQRKESIDLLDEFLKSTFLKTFGDPVKNEKGWKKRLLDSIVADDCPLTYGIVQPGNDFTNGVPVVRPVDLTQERVSKRGLKLIDPKISDKFKRTILKGDEILMCVRGTTGIVSLASAELKGCNVTRGITPIWFQKDFDKYFGLHLLKSSSFQNEISKKTYGATLQQINLSELRKLELIFPPRNIRDKFGLIARKTEILKEKYRVSLYELEQLYGSLSQQAFGSGQAEDKRYDDPFNVDEVTAKAQGEDFYRLWRETHDNKVLQKLLTVAKKYGVDTDLEKFKKVRNEALDRIIPDIHGSDVGGVLMYDNGNKSDRENSETSRNDLKILGKIHFKWQSVNKEELSDWIKKRYNGFNFNIEMIVRSLTEWIDRVAYFSSEELKKNPKVDEIEDLKAFIFLALTGENPFIRLEQKFYNEQTENFPLKLTTKDFELVKGKDASGIYFSIIS